MLKSVKNRFLRAPKMWSTRRHFKE